MAIWSSRFSRARLDELWALAIRPSCEFRPRWQIGDLAVRDNSCTLHRGLTYDDVRERRDMRRTTTEDASFASVLPPCMTEVRHAQRC